jgi:hypothetical protein
MNYQKIHDNIIYNALIRESVAPTNIFESHHIIPKCEGGDHDGPVVKLTQKEHRIIHKLRYKINGILGNILSYNLMKYGRHHINENLKMISSKGALSYHTSYKQNNPEQYIKNQTNAGIIGGKKCYDNNMGLFKLSKGEMSKNRSKGTQNIVNNKLGMFSDEYRKEHRKRLMKRVNTPDGIFDSMTEASIFYNVVLGTITYRVNCVNFKEWYYVEEN